MTVRIGVLVSGTGTNLQALIDGFTGKTHAELAVVISNKETAQGLERAQAASIPSVYIDHRQKSRTHFDTELVNCLREHSVDWVVLAGFMRIVTPTLLNAFPERIINIHPSLLPSFPGSHAQRQAFESGVQVVGATVHFVDGGTDTGPIIAQAAVSRREDDNFDDLRDRILKVEHRLLPMVVSWAVEGRIKVNEGDVSVDLPEGDTRSFWGD